MTLERVNRVTVTPAEAQRVLSRHVLLDGLDLVVDLEASEGSWLVDARDGRRYLDMFTFFASSPLGMNHRGLVEDAAFREELALVALSKPSNSDLCTTQLAEFAETFARVLGDPALPHLFFVEGGAVAVENALKVAFDWKRLHNAAGGRDPDRGTKVLHLSRAFHGRTGYTMSVTDTEPAKTARFPRFDWPRIDVPAVRHPLHEHLAEVEAAESRALEQARAAFAAHRDDIACFLAEPIQGEGGDNHMRAAFLLQMQALCREHDALFVLDEVQTGCGFTGTAWAYQQLGLEPDVVAFGKKTQVCGIMAGGRVDEVAGNVFEVPGRINSTWGGNLTDMVRARRILEVVEADELVEHAAGLGKELLDRLGSLAGAHPGLLSNPRGRGLMCAFDLPDTATRDDFQRRLFSEERVVMLGCGQRSMRFRPHLAVTSSELEQACDAVDRLLDRTGGAA